MYFTLVPLNNKTLNSEIETLHAAVKSVLESFSLNNKTLNSEIETASDETVDIIGFSF